MKHCLVVDDSDIVRKFARLIFESLGYRVSDASSIDEELWERVRADPPDLALVDWRMPQSNPHEFIARLRRTDLGKRITILYVPTENEAADLQKALEAGSDDVLMKPFNREIVEMKLHEMRVAA